jgi:hypothetical protein
MALFCRTIHQVLKDVQQSMYVDGKLQGLVVALADDTTFIGPPDIVFEAVNMFTTNIARLGLTLNPAKSSTLCLNPNIINHVEQLCTANGFPMPTQCLPVLGSFVGLHALEKEAIHDNINKDSFRRLKAINNPQIQLLILRHSIITSCTFLTRTMPPEALEGPLLELRELVRDALGHILGINQVSDDVIDAAALSLATGGLGLTDLYSVRHSAYYASVVHAIKTWSGWLSADNNIIRRWLDGTTRSSQVITNALQAQKELCKHFNTTAIVPLPLFGANVDGADKADPEAMLPTIVPPPLPQTIKQIPSLQRVAVDKVQRSLTSLHNVVSFRHSWGRLHKNNLAGRTQFLANSAPSSGAWLRTLPSNPKFRFPPKEFRICLLQHFALETDVVRLLGLSPTQPCVCNRSIPLNDNNNDDQAQAHSSANMATYQHLINCTRQDSYTTRHNALVMVCADAARSTGLSAHLETLASKAAPNDHGQRKRFDITVSGSPDLNILQLDVSVASHRQQDLPLATGCSRFALHAASNAAKAKINKYKDCIIHEDETFIPLIAETSGAIHQNFKMFFVTIGARVDGKPPQDATWTTPSFVSYWMAITSTVLRRETARALMRLAAACHQLTGNEDPEAQQDGEQDL